MTTYTITLTNADATKTFTVEAGDVNYAVYAAVKKMFKINKNANMQKSAVEGAQLTYEEQLVSGSYIGRAFDFYQLNHYSRGFYRCTVDAIATA